MTQGTENLLNRLSEILTNANAPILEVLQSGIDKGTVDGKLKAANINVALPEEVYALYQWRNGKRSRSGHTYAQLWFFDIGTFPSLEFSILNYEAVAGKDDYWKENMIMLFESGGGEMYLIDCDEKSPTYRMLFKHWAGAVDYEVIITMYDSLDSMLQAIIECFEKHIYYYDEERRFQSDFEGSVVVARKHNPKSDLWKIFQF